MCSRIVEVVLRRGVAGKKRVVFLTPVLLDTLTFLKFIELFWEDRSIFVVGGSFFFGLEVCVK